ncbi:type I methionyl aminopeptidase [Periweissella fabalis]|uniref:Methionine aminopeptidase n=1 Tax=Periweissella fabalis TaxID=1070421 RepID=A0A7X6S3S2_9LACO|nr:type I methionyl aminopeptidase [Periweissella fabalis]MCM0598869.1 type I methionyl aminopeptidase [Periweissella fabalis]NKZ24531.1 type I methionyl aminopeptidase [Periweissella fabalis]
MISLKSAREIEAMKASGAIIAGMHKELAQIIKPGMESWAIEEFCHKYIEEHGGVAAQIGFETYKYATCVSINDYVCHAIPRKGVFLKEGDIVKVDTVVELDGAFSDSCWTFAVGKVSPEVAALMEATKHALYLGIDQAVVGNRIGDIGAVIDGYLTENGYGNVREYIGHGIGPTMHEEPSVPHFGTAGRGLRLKEGMTITIEPMVTLGGWQTRIVAEESDWDAAKTADGSWCAQYEHTLAITKNGPKILTSQDPKEDAKYL